MLFDFFLFTPHNKGNEDRERREPIPVVEHEKKKIAARYVYFGRRKQPARPAAGPAVESSLLAPVQPWRKILDSPHSPQNSSPSHYLIFRAR